jgi:aconitate hydratase
VLTVTQILRKKGVVSKFVEYYGEGLADMPLEDRATIGNMVPEYGATCGFFPIDAETLRYLKATGRNAQRIALVEKYAKAQGLFHSKKSLEPAFTDTLHLDLATVESSLAGPRRPQDRVALSKVGGEFASALRDVFKKEAQALERVKIEGTQQSIGHGDVVIAAITSCTNTSNPYVMLGAGLLARSAVKRGLKVKPWVKTSLAPGSQVVTEYLARSGLDKSLSKLGFNLVGYGCTTCIGNSGPLPDAVGKAVTDGDLVVAAVLSGNRNFEGRVHAQVRANYLASPMLVVAFALAGNITGDLTQEPIGFDAKGEPVYLHDIWPSPKEIADTVRKSISPAMFRKRYADVFTGDKSWKKIKINKGKTYDWDEKSTYVKNPPYFEGMTNVPAPIANLKAARILGIFGDSITTDHISPAGSIKKDSPAGRYLIENGVAPVDFNSYGARRGNHQVMMRGTFANIRIKNEMLGGKEGGNTICYAKKPSGEEMSIYDAAMEYRAAGTPTVIVAGKEYGAGSSRDWAAKGPRLLGIGAVIAENYERIHRSNLVGMGILPLEFAGGKTRRDYRLTGQETIDIPVAEGASSTRKPVTAKLTYPDGRTIDLPLVARVDTVDEIGYFKSGGILQHVLRNLAAA